MDAFQMKYTKEKREEQCGFETYGIRPLNSLIKWLFCLSFLNFLVTAIRKQINYNKATLQFLILTFVKCQWEHWWLEGDFKRERIPNFKGGCLWCPLRPGCFSCLTPMDTLAPCAQVQLAARMDTCSQYAHTDTQRQTRIRTQRTSQTSRDSTVPLSAPRPAWT